MIKNPKLLTKSFLRSFAILGGVGLVIHIAIYLTFPFYYIQLEGEKFNESARVFTEYLKTKTSDEIPSLLQSYSKSLTISAHLKRDIVDKRLPLVHDLDIKDGKLSNYIVMLDMSVSTADGKQVTVQFVHGVDVYKEAKNILLLYLPYTFLVTIAFSFVFSYFYTKRLLNPLFYISEVTSKMQDLDDNIRFDESRKDEVGEVGKQINGMYEHLLKVIHELESRNEQIVKLQNQKVSFVRGASHELKTPLASLRIILENMQHNIGDYKDHPMTDATRVVMSLRALDKVLTNLISNAIKYSDKNGRVIISEQDGYLSIKNTCAPLSDQELEHLFDIFYHSQIVTDKDESSGLGLYIVNNILESYQMDYSFLPYEHGMEFKISL